MRRRTYILQLKRHNPQREREFELAYLQSLSSQERLRMMLQRSAEFRRLLPDHGYRRTAQVIQHA